MRPSSRGARNRPEAGAHGGRLEQAGRPQGRDREDPRLKVLAVPAGAYDIPRRRYSRTAIPRPKNTLRLAASVGVALALIAGGDTAFAATTLYVDKDSVGGGCSEGRSAAEVSEGAPWCSLERAVEAAPAGSKVLVRRGSYPRLVIEGVVNPEFVTFKAHPGEQPSVAGFQTENSSRFRFEGFRITNYNLVYSGSDRVQLVGNDITANTTVRPSTNTLFEGNYVHDTPVNHDDPIAAVGLWVVAGAGDVRGVTIRNNHFLRLPNDALFLSAREILVEGNRFEHIQSPDNDFAHADVIQCMGCDDLRVRSNYASDNDSGILNSVAESNRWTIENNFFVRCDSQPLQLDNENRDLIVTNNTFQDCGNSALFRWDPAFSQNPSGFVIANNIFDSLYIDPRLKIAVEDYNVIREGDGADNGPHDVVGRDPLFVNPSAGDYRLAPRSPAIDAAGAQFAPRLDAFGGLRPVDDPDVPNSGGGSPPFYDIGAHERLSRPGGNSRITPPLSRRKSGRRFVRLRLPRVQRLSQGALIAYARCLRRCRVAAWARFSLGPAGARKSAARARGRLSTRRVVRRLRGKRTTRLVLRFKPAAGGALRGALRKRSRLSGVVTLVALHGTKRSVVRRQVRLRR